jgi:hypothetical protein
MKKPTPNDQPAPAEARRGADIGTVCRFLAGSGREPLTPVRVSQLVSLGMPKLGRGLYDLSKCAYWYIGHLRRATDRKETEGDDGSFTGVARERSRLLKAQADNEEFASAKNRRQLMSVADFEKLMSEMVMETKARVMAVGPRVAPLVIGEQSRIMVQAIIEKELKLALRQLATSSVGLPEIDPPPSAAAKEQASAGASSPAGRQPAKRTRMRKRKK